MATMQRFRNVCDGGHILNLQDLTPESLAKALGLNHKAVLVVGNDQTQALRVLRSLNKKKFLGRRNYFNSRYGVFHHPMRAKLLTRWSPTGQLWMVRQDGRKF